MKKLLTTLFILISFTVFSQTDSTKNTRKELMDSVCVCAAKKDTASIKTKEDLQKMMMQCVMQRMDLMMQAMQDANIDLNDAEAGRAFGEKFGIELVMKCPVLLQASVKIAMNELDKPVTDKKAPAANKPKAVLKPTPAKPKTTSKN
jgi:hypothetical protein